ncbi:MAG TPA: hypothetical protein VK471_01645 [Solirubrobacterales bacterium]|nr:hypothetical protein [Solirubrobacterales bacterium]
MSPVVLVSGVGAAKGTRAVAAALACAASEPDRAALLIDLEEGRAPRSTLVASVGARRLEERLAAHLPVAAIASRGRICHLKLSPGREAIETLAAALPLARESAAVVHLPPALLRAMLGDARLQSTGVLLRADLIEDRALTALAVRDLMAEGLQVGIAKRPPGMLAACAAQLGVIPLGRQVFLNRSCERLLRVEDRRFRRCYDGKDESKDEQEEIRAERSRP